MSSHVTSAGMEPSTCWWSSTLGIVRSRASTSVGLEVSLGVAMTGLRWAETSTDAASGASWPAVKTNAAPRPWSLTPADRRRAARHLRRVDPVLGRIVSKVGACRLELDKRRGPFAYLVVAILHQQITGKAAASIGKRLRTLNRGRWPRPEQIAAASDEQLRACGLSRQKISYLRDLAAHAQNGPPLHRLTRLPEEEVIEALTAVRGIGRWTAEMYLMFRLGRPDVLPVDDFGVRKAMQIAYRKRALPKADWMRRTAETWRPWRTVASWYLWRSLA